MQSNESAIMDLEDRAASLESDVGRLETEVRDLKAHIITLSEALRFVLRRIIPEEPMTRIQLTENLPEPE
jgi:chaperonin cofactor prefoldin